LSAGHFALCGPSADTSLTPMIVMPITVNGIDGVHRLP
jgi:hypothetical protein